MQDQEPEEVLSDFQRFDGKDLTEKEEQDLDVQAEAAMWKGINLDALAPKITWRWSFQDQQKDMRDRLAVLGKPV